MSLLSIAGLAAGLVAPPLFSAQPVVPTYLLSIELRDGGRIVGTPRLKTRADEPAQIEIRAADGSGYSLRVTLTPKPDATVSLTSTINVYQPPALRRTASPVLLVKLGKASAIEFGEDPANQKPFRVDFTVEQVAG